MRTMSVQHFWNFFVDQREYESAAATYTKPSSEVTAGGNDYDAYVLALEDVIAQQMIDKENALAVTTSVTLAPYPTTAPNPTTTDIMAKMKKEMAILIAAAMAAATTTMVVATNTNGSSGSRGSGKDKNGSNLPKCPHCNKLATHKPDDCFSLPKNAEKMKTANFVNEKFVKKAE